MKILAFLKKHLHNITAFSCAVLIAVLSVVPVLSVPASAAPASWDDVGEDVIKLRDAYFEYFKNVTQGDFIAAGVTSAVDIPLSWLSTMADGTVALSPVDDIYYWLNNGVLTGGHRSGCTGGRSGLQRGLCAVCGNNYSHCTCDVFTYSGKLLNTYPEVSAEWLKERVKDYNSRYMPMQNEEQYIYNYQSAPNKTGIEYGGYYSFGPLCPAYTPSKQWGNKSWSEVYILIFLKDDDLSDVYYSNSYYHLYSDKSSEGVSQLKIEEYNLFDNILAWTESKDWDSFQYLLFSPEIKYGQMLYVYNASDFENYSRSLQPAPQGVTLSTPISRRYPKMGFISGSVINSSPKNITSVLGSSTFTPNTNVNDDWGVILSSKPFELLMNQQNIDFDRIPDNYTITISGDTIYNYPITNPETGDSTTINNYVSNTYNFPSSGGDSGDSGSGSGSTSGAIVVGGKVDVSGKVDINVNVSMPDSGSSGSGSVSGAGDSVDLSGYLDKLPEQSETMNDYFSSFFSFLPPEFLALMISGIAIAVLCRVLGR